MSEHDRRADPAPQPDQVLPFRQPTREEFWTAILVLRWLKRQYAEFHTDILNGLGGLKDYMREYAVLGLLASARQLEHVDETERAIKRASDGRDV